MKRVIEIYTAGKDIKACQKVQLNPSGEAVPWDLSAPIIGISTAPCNRGEPASICTGLSSDETSQVELVDRANSPAPLWRLLAGLGIILLLAFLVFYLGLI